MSGEKLLFYGAVAYVVYLWLNRSNTPNVAIPMAPAVCNLPGGGFGYQQIIAGAPVCLPPTASTQLYAS